jgi:hypothetical protein
LIARYHSEVAAFPKFGPKFGDRAVLDRVGMFVSTACAVHCAALPVLLTVAGLGWLGDERFEWSIILFSFAVASFRLFHSFFEQHRRRDALFLFLFGAAFILTAKSELLEFNNAEAVLMTIGGCSIAFAHWRNHQLCATCGVSSHNGQSSCGHSH